jgi:cyclohexanecarboxylate-CoA ligase
VAQPARVGGAALRPTWTHPRAASYRRAGGPWDTPSLDRALGPLAAADAHAVDALAGALRSYGVRRRDVVAWQLANCDAVLLLYRACWRLGAIAAPLHHLAGPQDVDAMIEVVDPAIVIGSPVEVAGMVDAGAPPVRAGGARASDLAVVLCTSGSAGTPKAVLHTHRALAYKAALMADVHGLDSRDAVLMPAPLAHISGLLNAVLVPGAAVMRTVLMAKWDPDEALAIIERERITFMIGPPTFFVSLMGASGFTPGRVASLRLISSGGAGVSPAFVAEASERFGCRVKRTYGSTEAPTVTTSAASDPEAWARDTDGRPVGEVEVRVAADGELLVRGPELFVGYADATQTRAAVRGGWFHTGDLATVDGDGCVTIVGRINDVIIRGGENIAAAEVEHVLEAHPLVRQAVVVGYPDERLGERVAVFVVADGPFDLATCQEWFASRGVARFKTPERVVPLDALPTMAAGKPDRAALRALL